LDCGVAVVMWERYSERLRSAIGVVLQTSKPRGLDVGVLTYAFPRFFLSRVTSLRVSIWLSAFIFLLVEVLRSRFSEFIQWESLGYFGFFRFDDWIEWMIRCFDPSFSCSLSPFGLSGGSSC
jgi:hypothetical protein